MIKIRNFLAVIGVLLAIPAWAVNYTDNGNGTVTDTRTKLVWQQTDDGVQRTWEGAIAYCEGLSLGGAIDWRLPNYKALLSLVDDSRSNPAIDPIFGNNNSPFFYWTSTTIPGQTPPNGLAAAVFFEQGTGAQDNKVNPYSLARCVRGGN
ncbi:MAG: DUF1566 domain-containing protein [Proteobacteria bacterium]|nr:DUF1566 domain-containing protein [Desulfobulbaceae bacterium]MBU4153689.1 DUF1566 domain-containing protein [Pseudomonadota bacterium]MDP2106030.1 DUF1566 domain-containing protein [Desulfobulbaceae bacterium]